jgi:hypothetical protein
MGNDGGAAKGGEIRLRRRIHQHFKRTTGPCNGAALGLDVHKLLLFL